MYVYILYCMLCINYIDYILITYNIYMCVCVCVCMTVSLCCTEEIGSTLYINYTLIKSKKEENLCLPLFPKFYHFGSYFLNKVSSMDLRSFFALFCFIHGCPINLAPFV